MNLLVVRHPFAVAFDRRCRIKWIGDGLKGGPHRVRIIVVPQEATERGADEVRSLLGRTRGAWGSGRSVDEIDAEIRAVRDEWDPLEANG